MDHKEQLQLIKERVRESYDLSGLKELYDTVNSFHDLFWFLQMTGLVPGLSKDSYYVMLKINGIDVPQDEDFTEPMIKAINERDAVDLDTKELTIDDIIAHMVDSIKNAYSLSDRKTYLLERVRSFTDLTNFLIMIEDLGIYDAMDTLDVIGPLLDPDWLPHDDCTPGYNAAWRKLQDEGDF